MVKRQTLGPIKTEKLLKELGRCCYYCGEKAVLLDHFIPWCYCESDDESNLVPCCVDCNLTAGRKMFDTLELKKQYIIQAKARRKTVHVSLWLREDFESLSYSLQTSLTNAIIVDTPEALRGLIRRLEAEDIKFIA
ncbi:hypothetical protein LCGC14_1009460 [marine sediment metagenome]|uniref:HNH nuclease domain-containing protein n=1 Tax=marine sediment metagenome TaxID=412755 RepID=A0A0F9NM39_9ZZZZ|nr:HNH endonuclease [Candidatus Aminicenantes bacterium]